MKKIPFKFDFLLILLVSISITLLGIPSLAQTALTEQSTVTLNGIGSVRVGMTIAEASRLTGQTFVQVGSGGEDYGCFYFQLTGLEGINFMVTEGRIARVDIENPQVTTVSGAKIGDTETHIKSLYPGQIQVTNHEYTDGHYLTFIPKDPADRNYRVVFETKDNRVTTYRSGKLPEVEYIEGCV